MSNHLSHQEAIRALILLSDRFRWLAYQRREVDIRLEETIARMVGQPIKTDRYNFKIILASGAPHLCGNRLPHSPPTRSTAHIGSRQINYRIS